MPDKFEGWGVALDSPAANAAAIVPNDGVDLAVSSRALYVGGAGDVRVAMAGGQIVTYTGMLTGWHPIRVKRVYATGTTATSLVAVW